MTRDDPRPQQNHRRFGPAPRGRAAGARPRPVRGRRLVSVSAPHARGALADRAWADRRDRHRAARCAARASSRSGPATTSPICRRSTSATTASRSSCPIASRCWRAAACAMSASRWRWCSRTIPIGRRTPPTRSTVEIEELPPVMSADDDAGRIRRRALDRADDHREGLRRPRRRVPRRACGRRARSCDRPPFRRAAGDARRDRALRRRRAMFWSCTAPPRCRIATASSSRKSSAGRSPSVHLFEGHVGGGFGVRGELYPEDVLVCLAALRLGRPVKWIEDRHEHFVAANHSRQQRHKIRAAVDARRPHPRRRGRFLPRPGRLCAHPRRARRRSHRRHAAGPLSHAGLPGRRALPADQQDAGRDLSLARPLREHVRARAPAWTRSPQRSASTASRCGGAT